MKQFYDILFEEGFFQKCNYVRVVLDSCMTMSPSDNRLCALRNVDVWGGQILRDELTRISLKYKQVRKYQFQLYTDFILPLHERMINYCTY